MFVLHRAETSNSWCVEHKSAEAGGEMAFIKYAIEWDFGAQERSRVRDDQNPTDFIRKG